MYGLACSKIRGILRVEPRASASPHSNRSSSTFSSAVKTAPCNQRHLRTVSDVWR